MFLPAHQRMYLYIYIYMMCLWIVYDVCLCNIKVSTFISSYLWYYIFYIVCILHLHKHSIVIRALYETTYDIFKIYNTYKFVVNCVNHYSRQCRESDITIKLCFTIHISELFIIITFLIVIKAYWLLTFSDT